MTRVRLAQLAAGIAVFVLVMLLSGSRSQVITEFPGERLPPGFAAVIHSPDPRRGTFAINAETIGSAEATRGLSFLVPKGPDDVVAGPDGFTDYSFRIVEVRTGSQVVEVGQQDAFHTSHSLYEAFADRIVPISYRTGSMASPTMLCVAILAGLFTAWFIGRRWGPPPMPGVESSAKRHP
jgi:hypothetical protein